MTVIRTAERLSFSEADACLDGALANSFDGEYDTVLFFAGDLVVDGDFLTAMAKIHGLREDDELVVIAGDLTVAGPLALYEDLPGLYVGGFTRAETLEAGDPEIYLHDGAFTHVVYGSYNDGALRAGTIETPWVINYSHDMRITAADALMVDNYGDSDDADFTQGNIPRSFVQEVVDPECGQVRFDVFLDRLRAGRSVLRPWALTHRQHALADVTAARVAHAHELDLTGRKLKAFPLEVLEMPWLRSLVLDDNPIGQLPAEIGTLTALTHLSVRQCGLATLPESIGELSELRVLSVGNNATGVAKPFVLPDTVGRLGNLEELDASGLSARVFNTVEVLPEIPIFVLPAAVGGLGRLRRLVADQTNLVIPPAMHGMASVQEISMAGDSYRYLLRFPDAVTTFPELRKLNLSGNFFPEIPETLLRLVKLEELDLGGSLGLVAVPLPDLSALPKLRVLDVQGITNRADVSVPGHELLRPLFGMALTALEELRVSRWGARDGRGPMTADMLAGIGAFRAVRRLDLSCNDLTSLPDECYLLPALEWLDLRRNAMNHAVRQRIAAAYPNARVDVRDQQGTDRSAELEQIRAVDAVIKEANELRDRRDWAAALAAYDRAIAHFSDGSADSSYGLLYAHYGKMWIHGTAGNGSNGTAAERAAHLRDGIVVAERCMELVSPVWQFMHFTDEGEFQREVVRYATNFIAWETACAVPAPTPEALARAAELIEQGVACGCDREHVYLLDTQARVLLALGRETEAWQAVRRANALDPEFRPIADLKLDHRYQEWLR